jgi:branched-chain amino acid transport system permease protein
MPVDLTILLFLVQDGVINGAVYALGAIALVLVFAVTRVIFVPQGEFIAFSAMTVYALENGRSPPTAVLLLVLGVLAAAATLIRERRHLTPRVLLVTAAFNLLLPAALFALVRWLAPMRLGPWAEVPLAIALVVPMGPMIYRIAFEPLAQASVLVLLIAAFGVHFSIEGLGLYFFGPEGIGTAPLAGGSFSLGSLVVTGQSLAVLGAAALLLIIFHLFFQHTLLGKGLRACASNRLGAGLVGIPTVLAGQIAFALAAAMAAVAGILIGPIQTVYYDSGFLIGLKAFVAAMIGGLVSYPFAVIAALAVGIAEAFFSFWASNFKEALVFALLIPFLLIRSLGVRPHEDEPE